MLKECVECQHCKSEWKHYEFMPEPFNPSLEFYCLKDNKYLGNMVKDKNEIGCLPCFEKRQDKQLW